MHRRIDSSLLIDTSGNLIRNMVTISSLLFDNFQENLLLMSSLLSKINKIRLKLPQAFTHTCTHTLSFSLSLYIYIFWQHFFINTNFVEHNRHFLMMAQSRAESTRDIYNYGKYINQFLPNTIEPIQQYERINKKICRQKMSVMFNEICINIYIYIYIYFKMNRSPKIFIFFKNFLFRSYIHVCFQLVAFVREHFVIY